MEKKRAADITCEVAHLYKKGQFAEAVNTLKAFVNSEIVDELEELIKPDGKWSHSVGGFEIEERINEIKEDGS